MGAILLFLPLSAMQDDAAAKVLGMLDVADRAAEQAEHKWHKLNENRLFARAKDGLVALYEAGKDWIETGNEDAEELARMRISQLELLEHDETLSLEQRRAARDERLMLEQDAYRRNERWHAFGNSIRGQALGIGLQVSQFFATELGAQQQHERRLEELALQGQADREARVAVAQQYIQALKDNPRLFLGVLGALSIIIPSGYYLSKYGIDSIFEYYRTPELADKDKTSLSKGWLSSFFEEEDEPILSDVILAPDVALRIRETMHQLKYTAAHGGFLKNILLYGEPGVGKTMVAQRMGRGCGFDYIYFAASKLLAFSKREAVAKLVGLFRFAQNSSRKLLIIIDEIELLAAHRSNPTVSDEMKTLFNALLEYMSDQSRDYMVIGITNRKWDLDPAFISRCDDKLFIDMPGLSERKALLTLYIDKYLVRGENLTKPPSSFFSTGYWFGTEPILLPRIERAALSKEVIDTLASRLVGFAGRDIMKLVLQIQSSALASDANSITPELVERVVATKLAEITTDEETLASPRRT